MRPLHVLLVEDNEGDIRLTQEAFKEGRSVDKLSVVRNGKEALDFVYRRGLFVDAEAPGLILLDLNLPLMNGDEVLRMIKEDASIQYIPVVILTTPPSTEEIWDALKHLADACINKPVDVGELMEKIKIF
jgi:CheY-like chemotaxis protein